MSHDRIVNQHQPGLALYPRNLSYDLLPLIGPAGWSLLRALHDHADEQALRFRGARPIAPSAAEMEAAAGVGEASLLVIKELLRLCGCLSWEDMRGKQEPRPGRRLKQAPTRSLVYYLHPLSGLEIDLALVQRVMGYALRSDRARAYLKANGLLRPRPAFLPSSVWPGLLPRLLQDATWQQLFLQVHGREAHLSYLREAETWLDAAAEVVATLEWEQQSRHERENLSVHDRAITVKARWHTDVGLPSPRRHGELAVSHADSPLAPHTPGIESTNQPTGITGGQVEKDGQREPRQAKGERHAAGWADAAGCVAGFPPPAAPGLAVEDQAQADAALWAAVPAILCAADGRSSGGAPRASYQPSRGEQRQARRLLREHSVEVVLEALRQATRSYHPEPGQPPTITRFGFATGLPCFRATLEVPPRVLQQTEVSAPAPVEPGADDFMHELERLNGRFPSRADRARLTELAATWGWRQLLIWLERWDNAHPDREATVAPAYFQACAASALAGDDGRFAPAVAVSRHNDMPPQASVVDPTWRRVPAIGPAHHAPPVVEPAGRSSAGEAEGADRRMVVEQQLAAAGIRKARRLAALPSTTEALVTAWIEEAQRRTGLKDRAGFIAAGVESGGPPDRRPAQTALFAPTTAMPRGGPANDPSDGHAGVWARVLERLRGQIDGLSWETWLLAARLLDVVDGVAIVGVPNVFARDELCRLLAPLTAALGEELGHAVEVDIVIGGLMVI